MAIYKTEDVVKGENAIWPWMSDYRQPTKNGYDFVGWEYNGTTYKPPFSGSPMASPFGPINGNAEVYAIWKKSAETYYEVVWKDGDFPPLPDQYEVEVTSDSSITATEGDEITISAIFKKGSTSYTAPYSAIFKRTGSSTYTKIKSEQNSSDISHVLSAEYGTTGFMVVMNDSEINSVEDNLDRTWISATISQAGEHNYEVDITSDKNITYNIDDRGEIKASFKEDGNNYSAYSTIFKVFKINGEEIYNKYYGSEDKTYLEVFNYHITEDDYNNDLQGFVVVMSDEKIDEIIESPKNYLAKDRIYARKQGDTGDLDTLLEPFETYLKKNHLLYMVI